MKIAPYIDTLDTVEWRNVRDLVFPMRFSFTLTYRPQDKTYSGVCHNLTNGVVDSEFDMETGSVYTMLNSGTLVRQDGTVPDLDPIDV